MITLAPSHDNTMNQQTLPHKRTQRKQPKSQIQVRSYPTLALAKLSVLIVNTCIPAKKPGMKTLLLLIMGGHAVLTLNLFKQTKQPDENKSESVGLERGREGGQGREDGGGGGGRGCIRSQ